MYSIDCKASIKLTKNLFQVHSNNENTEQAYCVPSLMFPWPVSRIFAPYKKIHDKTNYND